MWIKYLDATLHKELMHGKRYCIKSGEGLDDYEGYAKFNVYEGGEECGFICLHTKKPIRVAYFRKLVRDVDFY